MIYPDDNRLETSVYFVEANSFERLKLWEEYHKEVDWEEDNSGFYQTVGELGKGKPISVCFVFDKIYGVRICFYDVTSRYSDYVMVEKFIKENYTRNLTNAMNFHHAIQECEKIGYEQWLRKQKLNKLKELKY
jgi:hypothetical protein